MSGAKFSATIRIALLIGIKLILSNSRLASKTFKGAIRATVRRTSILEILEEVDWVLSSCNKSGLSFSSNIVFKIAELSKYQLNSVPLLVAPKEHR